MAAQRTGRVDGEEILMGFLLGGLMLGGIATSVARAARRGAAYQRRIESIWRAAAEELGASLEVGRRAVLEPRRLVMRLVRDGLTVVCETNCPVDPAAYSFTECRAAWALGVGPQFRLAPREAAMIPANSLGHHEDFDRGYELASKEPVWTRSRLSLSFAEDVVALGRRVDVAGDSDGIRVLWPASEREPEVLVDAITLTLKLASSGLADLRVFTRIDGAKLVHRPDGAARVLVHRGSAAISIAAVRGPAGPTFAATVRVRQRRAAFEVEIAQDDNPAPALGRVRPPFAPEASAELGRVGVGTLWGEADRVGFRWLRDPTAEEMDAAVRFLASVGAQAGRRGAFR